MTIYLLPLLLKAPSVRRPGSQIRVLLICAIRLVVTSELARRCFFAETEGVLLCMSREPRQTEPAAKAAGELKVNSPSPRFAGSSVGEGAKIFGKPQFISFPTRKKSAFIRAAEILPLRPTRIVFAADGYPFGNDDSFPLHRTRAAVRENLSRTAARHGYGWAVISLSEPL